MICNIITTKIVEWKKMDRMDIDVSMKLYNFDIDNYPNDGRYLNQDDFQYA